MKYATAISPLEMKAAQLVLKPNGYQEASEKLDEAGEEHQREKRRGASIFAHATEPTEQFLRAVLSEQEPDHDAHGSVDQTREFAEKTLPVSTLVKEWSDTGFTGALPF